MKIFDDIPRSDIAYRHERESSFAFLNRCARPEFAQVREFLEGDVLRFPSEGRDGLIRRLQRGSEADHAAAIFELLLHGGLLRRGYVLQPHPTTVSGRQPDFRVTTPTGDKFYLEATQATEMFDGRDDSAAKRANTVLDDLNRDVHPDFWLLTSSTGKPTTQPSSKKLRSDVSKWLASLNYHDVTATIRGLGYEAAPSLRWRHEGWILTMRAVPMSQAMRGKSEGLVASRSGGSGWVDRMGPLRNALNHKSGHYGELDLPLVVAVNVTSGFLNRMDEVHALYGDHVHLADDAAATATVSGPLGGFWYNGVRPRRTQLSAAWIFRSLNVYNRHIAEDTLYLHPWAERAMPDDLMEFGTASLGGYIVRWKEGARLCSVFPPDPVTA